MTDGSRLCYRPYPKHPERRHPFEGIITLEAGPGLTAQTAVVAKSAQLRIDQVGAPDNSRGKPLVRPDSKRIDRCGSRILSKWLDEPTRRGCNVGALSKPIPFEMGLQVPRCFRAQTTTQGHLWPSASSIGTNFPGLGQTKRAPNHRRTPNARPCTYVHLRFHQSTRWRS